MVFVDVGWERFKGYFSATSSWVDRCQFFIKTLDPSLKSFLYLFNDFFSKVKNFREIYSAKEGRRRVLALQEQTSKQDKIIIAEYENFDTPVCEYLKEQRIAQPGLDLELLESASGLKLISCITDGDIQRVEAVKAAEFLWPELTAKLRIGLE